VNTIRRKINENITSDKVLIISSEDGYKSSMCKTEALSLARQQSLDLVEFAIQDGVSVCKILDHQKILFKESKQERKQIVKLKELQFGIFISPKDMSNKIDKAMLFLQKGHQVKISITGRGRQMAHKDRAIDIKKAIMDALDTYGTFTTSASEAHTQRAICMMIIMPTSNNKNT